MVGQSRPRCMTKHEIARTLCVQAQPTCGEGGRRVYDSGRLHAALAVARGDAEHLGRDIGPGQSRGSSRS
jgi:hypothetical protein